MTARRLGLTDLTVPSLCLGTMQFGWTADEPTSHMILSSAYERGFNFLDTADVYSRWVEGNPGGVSEEIIGRWMKANHISRPRIILATKVRGRMGPGPEDEGLSRRHILEAVENSLRRLQTEYIDLYQAHSPDEKTPIEETLEAFTTLVKQGKVRHVGASNYSAWLLMQALWSSDKNSLARYDCLQPHYNLVHREEFERELESVCRTYSIGVIPYSPLAGGFLTGKYPRQGEAPKSARAARVQKYYTERNWHLLDTLQKMGRSKGASPSQIALAWLLSRPAVTSPIIGPNSAAQLEDNLGAVAIDLTSEEIALLEKESAWKDLP